MNISAELIGTLLSKLTYLIILYSYPHKDTYTQYAICIHKMLDFRTLLLS